MSPQEVVDSINEAYSNKVLANGNKYIGKSSNGLKIGMYIRKSDGKIIQNIQRVNPKVFRIKSFK